MLQVWKYRDYMNVERHGIMQGFSDFGGTDVSYRFHQLGEDGLPITFPNGGIRLDIVSGQRLKEAQRVGAVHQGQPYIISE